ncbi:MAG: lytic transglycosylase domain-containing protein [Chitinophagaceae bacterium]|jgi:membrane-bound lytic murein transglycosylase D|nr:lytic transglycosylase domain-containing protein [Chitinophagaceae bacterium]
MQRLHNYWGSIKTTTKVYLLTMLVVVLGFTSASFAHINGNVFHFAKSFDTTKNDISLIESLAPNNQNYFTQPVEAPLNPLAVGFVNQYAAKQGESFEKMKVWGKPYFDLYDKILPLYGIPVELKYLSVIESSLNPRTVSWAGAVGPWQLMPDEGKRFGLKRTNYSDERMDFYKSTHAACKLIKELHETFGDWLLVIAAYNGGVGRVKQCIRKAGGKKSFWDIQYFLPEETRNHVKKYIATHYIFEGSGGWTTMTAKETQIFLAARAIDNQEPILAQNDQFNTTVVEVGGRYLAVVVANYLLMDIDQFNKWNPAFDKTLASGKRYKMRLNKDRAVVFEAKKSQILLESVRTLINGEETVVASK